MQQAAETPEAFAIREHDFRRVNLQRFPYHFFARVVCGVLRILVVAPSQKTLSRWRQAAIDVSNRRLVRSQNSISH